MDKYELVTPQLVRQLLDYDPDTGLFLWKSRGVPQWDARYVSTPALTFVQHGYHVGTIMRRMFRAHCVAIAHVYGHWPSGPVDHINRDRSDNRISNLRVASVEQNNRNKSTARNNTSGVTGVSYNKALEMWEAYINARGRRVRIGFFTDADAAATARKIAEKTHGYGA